MQVHTGTRGTQKYIQVHIDISRYRYMQVYGYTKLHASICRYMQVHAGAHRYTQVHTVHAWARVLQGAPLRYKHGVDLKLKRLHRNARKGHLLGTAG